MDVTCVWPGRGGTATARRQLLRSKLGYRAADSNVLGEAVTPSVVATKRDPTAGGRDPLEWRRPSLSCISNTISGPELLAKFISRNGESSLSELNPDRETGSKIIQKFQNI